VVDSLQCIFLLIGPAHWYPIEGLLPLNAGWQQKIKQGRNKAIGATAILDILKRRPQEKI
jgi:hypothetical protein